MWNVLVRNEEKESGKDQKMKNKNGSKLQQFQ